MKTIEVLRRLDRETKAEVYLVGGYVRDYLRNKRNFDLDVVIIGLSMRNIKKFLNGYGKTKEVRLSKVNDIFSINILLFKASKNDCEAQITLPRRSKKQIQYAHNTLKQDVRFRDFKINALYLPVNYNSKADVVDLVGGRADIFNRRISANGSANERIKESPIRMLRAISLASRTNYALDNELTNAIRANAFLINKCPAETIRTEFNKILMSKRPSKYIQLLRKTRLLAYIAPELHKCIGIKQDSKYHKYDVFTHLIYTVDNCDFNLILRLAGLLHDIGKPSTCRKYRDGKDLKITFYKHEVVSGHLASNFLKRMKYSTDTTRQVLLLVKLHMYHFTRNWTDAAIRKFIKRSAIDEKFLTEKTIGNFPLFRLRAAERLGNGFKGEAVTNRQRDFEKRLIHVYNESSGLEITDLKINGNIIMDIFKLRPGVQIGSILVFLLERVIEKPVLNNELDLLKLTTEYLHKERDNGGKKSLEKPKPSHIFGKVAGKDTKLQTN